MTVTQPVNKKAIDKTIALIEAMVPDKIQMHKFMRLNSEAIPDQFKGTGECLSAACIGGWVVTANCPITTVLNDYVRLKDSREERQIGVLAQEVLNLDRERASDLFYMQGVPAGTWMWLCRQLGIENMQQYHTVLDMFDTFPADFRKRAALKVLRNLRNYDVVDWGQAMKDCLD